MRFLKTIILFVFFTFSINSITAQNDLPRSTFNIGAGVGQSYGIIGIKSVIGIKNSGLLLGIGTIPGTNLAGYAVGLQISEDWLFASLTYGSIGAFNVNSGPWEPIEAGNVMIGAMLSVNSSKRAFIELSLGAFFRCYTGAFRTFRRG